MVTVTASEEGLDDDKPYPMSGFADTDDTQNCCVCTCGTRLTKEKAPFPPQSTLSSWSSSGPY